MSIHSVRIPDKLDQEINALLDPTVSRSEVIRNALMEYVRREKFRKLRNQILPFAEAQGLLVDEDIFENI